MVTAVTEAYFDGSTSKSLNCYATVVAPGSFLEAPRTLSLKTSGFSLTPSDRVRYFAGQADLNDASHFTVNYRGDSTTGVLDGYLRDDDIVKLELRLLSPPPPPSAASPPSPG